MKIPRANIYSLVGLAVIAATAVISYQVGKSQSDDLIASLTEQVDSLRKGEMDAAIVKRVSQQMEDIAYQQKAVSDKQREHAEEQSKLAIKMRDMAEQESRAAREAEGKAVEALDEAEAQRNNARQQQLVAEQQRDQATRSKNRADTLNYRMQGRTLASTSLIQRDANDLDVSDALAYTSWYFLNKYEGNDFFSTTFRALQKATGSMYQSTMQKHGAVNGVAVVPNLSKQCVAVSNYGEIELLTDKGDRIASKVLLSDNAYDFRDVWAGQKGIYALSVKGTLCVVSYNGAKIHTVTLPADTYVRLIHVDSNTLAAVGRKSMCWYTFSTGEVSKPLNFQSQMSAVAKRKDVISVFFADGKYAEVDKAHKIVQKTPITKEIVTVAHYDEELDCFYLGTKDGPVYPFNRYNRKVELLNAHVAQPTCIANVGSILITGGYDKSAFVWQMDNLYFESGLNFRQELALQKSAKAPERMSNLPKEWVVPAELDFDGWILSLCGDARNRTVWAGTSTGKVVRMMADTKDMAAILHAKMKRGLSESEWTRYVGSAIPYVKMK